MKKLLVSLGAVAALLLIVLVGALAYVFTFDPNENKDWIAGKFLEATGRELTLGGNIDLSWYPWLGLAVDDIGISNGAGFSAMPLLQAEHAAVRIKLLPLLGGSYEIDTVRLHGARVNLEVLPDGEANWELTTADGTETAETSEPGAMPDDLILGGVDIRDTSVVYDDQQAGTHYEVSNLDMAVGELVYGEPLDIGMTLDATSRTPELTAALTLNGTVVYDVDNGRYNLNPLALDATLSGPDVPSGSAALALDTAVAVDLDADTLNMSNLTLTMLNTSLMAGIDASRISTETPAVNVSLDLRGDDLAALFRIFEQDDLAARIGSLDNNFSIMARMNADMQTGTVNVPDLRAMLLGADVSGTLDASRINTETPMINGNLTAAGPDLPMLIELAGILQGGGDSALSQTGRDLGRVPDKSFRVESAFTADLQAGDIQLPMLTAALLGFRLDGALDARDMHDSDGTIDGRLNLQGDSLREVLAALDQPDLAEVAQSMTLDIGVSGSSSALRISPLNLDVVLSGARIPNSPQTLALDANPVLNLVNDSLQMDAFTLTGLGLNVNGSLNASSLVNNPAFNGTLDVPAFDARALLQQLNQPVPETADATVLTNVALTTAFQGTNASASLSDLVLVLDDSRITGNLAVSDFATQSSSFAVNIDRIDADRYLAPPAETTAAESTESEPLPVDELRQLAIDGALNIGELTISGLNMRDIVVELTAANGDIALNPVQASLYDGTFAGNLRLNAQGEVPTATVNTTLSAINLEPLLQDFTDATSAYLTGVANIELALSGTGADTPALKNNLNGSGSLAVENGILAGVDVAAVLQSIETMIRSRQLVDIPQGGETPFENFSATLGIQNGVVTSDDLLIDAPGWQVNGSGTLVNLGDDTIDFDLLTSVDPATATTADEEYDLGGYTLPIACTGSISGPRCLPDAQQIIAAAVTNAVQRRLGDFIQDRLGGGEQQPAPGTEPAPAQEAPTQEAPAEEPADPEEELIDRALDRLLR